MELSGVNWVNLAVNLEHLVFIHLSREEKTFWENVIIRHRAQSQWKVSHQAKTSQWVYHRQGNGFRLVTVLSVALRRHWWMKSQCRQIHFFFLFWHLSGFNVSLLLLSLFYRWGQTDRFHDMLKITWAACVRVRNCTWISQLWGCCSWHCIILTAIHTSRLTFSVSFLCLQTVSILNKSNKKKLKSVLQFNMFNHFYTVA